MSHEDTVEDLFELGIEPLGRETSKHVVLSRPDRNPDFFRYEGAGSNGVVYVHRDAAEQMRLISQAAMPNETIGMLCGRPCTDEHGDYTLVLAVEPARPGEYVGTPGTVRISSAGRLALRRRAAQRWPGWEDVGWFHTHPHGAPRFSSVDFDEQATLQPHQVGIVAAVSYYRNDREDPLGVYIGPNRDRLARAHAPTPVQYDTPEREVVVLEEEVVQTKYFTPELLKQLRVGVGASVAILLLSQALAANWVRGVVDDRALQTAGAAVTPATVAAPERKTATRTKTVVRSRPALVTARRCEAGGRVRLGVQVPQAFRDGLAVSALNPAIATVSYDVATRSVDVTCLSPGTTVVQFRHSATGASASVAVAVRAAPPSSRSSP
ncbi:hypothetical protein DSM112329_00189 [Paraconexibacter sp. AEG42_29]|uniref:JAB domain-containing protein n=1 Tax=Paraconexibacter sp. AEG42_29 TaxID=2997339 RepID=A0AAU7AP33_9ACTN